MLKNKVILISGASKGFGKALALASANQGARLAVFARSEDQLKTLTDSVTVEVFAEALDICDHNSVQDFVRRVHEKFERIDILINNAAQLGATGPLDQVDCDALTDIFQTNVPALIQLTNTVIPIMKKQQSGTIVNITSSLAEKVMTGLGPYSLTKAALDHYTRVSAEELKADSIGVIGFSPGVMDTQMQSQIREAGEKHLGKKVFNYFNALHSSNRLQDVNDVAEQLLEILNQSDKIISGRVYAAN